MDKSNILGINASIESARAGEHGRGFAVVAHEVMKLASNTKLSAGSIETDVQGVQGVQDSVRRLVDYVNELATISEAQAIKITTTSGCVNWSQRWDSNPQPTDYKSVALPIELRS